MFHLKTSFAWFYFEHVTTERIFADNARMRRETNCTNSSSHAVAVCPVNSLYIPLPEIRNISVILTQESDSPVKTRKIL